MKKTKLNAPANQHSMFKFLTTRPVGIEPVAAAAATPSRKRPPLGEVDANEDSNHNAAMHGDRGKVNENENDLKVQAPAKKQPTAAAAVVEECEYERERTARIARNRAVLAGLGLGGDSPALSPRARPPTTRRPRPPPAESTRRSTRRVDLTAAAAAAPAEPEAEAESEVEPDVVADDDVDSDVHRYTCVGDAGGGVPLVVAERPGVLPVGYGLVAGQTLGAESAGRIVYYSADTAVGGGHPLVAAGGMGGHVAVFGVCPLVSAPLAAWRAHSGWASCVQFLSGGGEGTPLMMTSGNDGAVRLWDLRRCGAAGTPQAGTPHQAAGYESKTPGVFAAHELGGRALAALKTTAVAVLDVTPTGLTLSRTIAKIHAKGPIKCARWRPGSAPTVMADAGFDGKLCVCDLRLPGSVLVASVDAGHRGPSNQAAVNIVEWHPEEEHTLLTTGFDAVIRLWDVRRLEEPVTKLVGHAKTQDVSSIYRASWVAGGRAVVTGGQGSGLLSLYDVATGRAISRGEVGYDPTIVLPSAGGALWLCRGGQLDAYGPRYA